MPTKRYSLPATNRLPKGRWTIVSRAAGPFKRASLVNTIHCGNHASGVSGEWQQGAQLAEGEFFNIDQDRAVVHIECPQDEMILRLNTELNKTYLWYGDQAKRESLAANQVRSRHERRNGG